MKTTENGWLGVMICAKKFGQGDGFKTSAPALDKNASSERICAMPFGYHVGDSVLDFNIRFLGHAK